MKLSNSQQAFLELIRAGLWEKEALLKPYGDIDFKNIYRLSQEQAVVGLVAAGLEHVHDVKVPTEDALLFAGEALQLEQRNTAMNYFIGVTVDKMREAGIMPLLVKGQGVALCYERPLWRSSGDIDLLLDTDNYYKAVKFLTPLASVVNEEDPIRLHQAMTIVPWEVELHGTLRTCLWNKMDKEIDAIQNDTFLNNKVRIWKNGTSDVLLPAPDNDVIFVFTHIIQHFYKEGIGIRQICDLCRLLWKYNSVLDYNLLEARLIRMDLLDEWKVFACFMVEYFGMPYNAIPLYSDGKRWKRKVIKVLTFIFKTGNFGHNRDYSYQFKHTFFIRKIISFCRHSNDNFCYFLIFPRNSIRVWWRMLKTGMEEIGKKGYVKNIT